MEYRTMNTTYARTLAAALTFTLAACGKEYVEGEGKATNGFTVTGDCGPEGLNLSDCLSGTSSTSDTDTTTGGETDSTSTSDTGGSTTVVETTTASPTTTGGETDTTSSTTGGDTDDSTTTGSTTTGGEPECGNGICEVGEQTPGKYLCKKDCEDKN